jgi:hypothetical protein
MYPKIEMTNKTKSKKLNNTVFQRVKNWLLPVVWMLVSYDLGGLAVGALVWVAGVFGLQVATTGDAGAVTENVSLTDG